jgi:hypothetical protein
MRSDYRGAEMQLTAAVKSAKSKTELAETYKYLGVAQYMRGQKAAANTSFVRAKTLNPMVKLTANDVADESVLPVFAAAKSSPQTSRPSQQQSPAATPKSSAITKQKSKRTLLKVLSNVPTARVSLDGIAYGTAGQDIEVQPGTVVLEVSAPGFISKAVKVQLEAMTTSSITVNLDKILPKPKPRPQTQALASKPARGIPLPGMNSSTPSTPKNRTGAAGKKPKHDLFGGDEIADDFSQFQQPMAAQPQVTTPQMVTPPPPPQQPVMPPQGYGAGPYGLQPAYPQSPYPQSPYPQSPYAPQPYSGYPVAPAYPSFPTYQAPAYGPAPYPMQPYGGYAAQPVNPYAYTQPMPPTPPPSPVYSAPVDPYGGYLGPPPEAPTTTPPPAVDPGPSVSERASGGMPPPPILPPPASSKGSTKRTIAKTEKCSTLVKILPFGFGQFCKGSTAKGLFFLGSEAGALYFYKSNSDAATSYQSRLNQILTERDAARADVPAEEQEAFDSETAAKETQGKAAINKAKQNAQYSMLAFVGLWGAGAFDALTSPDSSPSGKSKKSKRARPRIMHSYHLDLETAPFGTVAMEWPVANALTPLHLDSEILFGYTPTLDPRDARLRHALTMGITWDL